MSKQTISGIVELRKPTMLGGFCVTLEQLPSNSRKFYLRVTEEKPVRRVKHYRPGRKTLDDSSGPAQT